MVCAVVVGVLAPFPASHPLNFANPAIEPVWDQLSEDTQASIYDSWLSVEPLKKALFEYKEKADRRAQADQRAWLAGKDLLAAKAKELKDAWNGHYVSPEFYNIVEEPKNSQGKTRTEVKYVPGTQLKWENFQTAFQHAVYLRLAEKRAIYQKVLERARLSGRTHKAEQRNLLKYVLSAKEKVEEGYLSKLEKVKDALYKIWLKGDGLKGSVEADLKGFW